MSSWHSLYLPSSESEVLATALITSLTDQGYTLYDPFGLIPGVRAYSESVKLFIAPPTADPQPGWTRLILAPDAALPAVLCADLSKIAPCLVISLHEGAASIQVYHAGAAFATLQEGLAVLSPYFLHPLTDLPSVESSKDAPASPSASIPGDLPATLSNDLKIMTEGVNARHQVNPQQAQQMFNKITGKLLKGQDQSAARALLQGGAVDWNSSGGQTILALMNALKIPGWREPDYVPLRDAYQLHNRRRRSPKAALYPGDAEAMAAVPDALLYLPIFSGK